MSRRRPLTTAYHVLAVAVMVYLTARAFVPFALALLTP